MILDRSFGARVLQSIDVYTWCMAARSILRNAPFIVEVIVDRPRMDQSHSNRHELFFF